MPWPVMLKKLKLNGSMRTFRTDNPKICPFYSWGLECKSRKSRNTWNNRQIWPSSTAWSRAKTHRLLPRECTDTLSQNRHLVILNILSQRTLDESRKRKAIWPSLHASSLKWVIKLSYESCPPYTQRKGTSLFPKTNGHWKIQRSLAKFPLVYSWLLTSYCSPIIFLHDSPLSIKLSIRILKSVSAGLHFLMKATVSHKIYIKYTCMFLSY